MSNLLDAREAEALLHELERRLSLVDAQLLSAEPARLEQACAEVRDGSFAVADLLAMSSAARGLPHSAQDAVLRKRIDSVAQRLLDQRNCLARRSVVVDRTLDSIMRPEREATYRVPGARRAFGKS